MRGVSDDALVAKNSKFSERSTKPSGDDEGLLPLRTRLESPLEPKLSFELPCLGPARTLAEKEAVSSPVLAADSTSRVQGERPIADKYVSLLHAKNLQPLRPASHPVSWVGKGRNGGITPAKC